MFRNRDGYGKAGIALAFALCVAAGGSAQDAVTANAATTGVQAAAAEEGGGENSGSDNAEGGGNAKAGGENTMRATLDSVVVSAAGYEQDVDEAPASISIITREQLQEMPFNNLADALKDMPGINYIGSDGNERDISIRGLTGDYTLIMVDGKRQGTRESRPNGSGGFEAGWIPPLAAIERIEVIRGPMSTLYGSDAMGGVINIITRKDVKEWHGTVSTDYTLQSNSESGNIANTNFFLGGPLFTEKVALHIFGSGNWREEDEIVGGYKGAENKKINARLMLTPFENHRFTFEAGQNEQVRKVSPGKTQVLTAPGSGALNSPTTKIREEHTRTHWSAGYEGKWNIATTKLNVYQEIAERKNKYRDLDPLSTLDYSSYNERRPKITNTVVDGAVTFDLPRNMLTVGGQYQFSKLKDDSVYDRDPVTNMGISRPISVDVYQYAFFAENDFSILDNLILTTGMRMDEHENYGTHWSPRGYLVYKLTPEWTIKGGIATAFKAPTLRETSGGYGTGTNGGRAMIVGNPDLKPEKSVSEEIGVTYRHAKGYTASMTFFHTNLKNRVSNRSTGLTGPGGIPLWEYYNIGEAMIRGVESGLTIPILKNLRFSAQYTYMDSQRKTYEGEATRGYPLTMTPMHHGSARIDWDATKKLSTYFRVEYTGKQTYNASARGSSTTRYRNAFTTADVGGTYFVNDSVQISAAIINLANQRELPNDAVDERAATIEDGRRFWLGVTVNF